MEAAELEDKRLWTEDDVYELGRSVYFSKAGCFLRALHNRDSVILCEQNAMSRLVVRLLKGKLRNEGR